MQSNPNTCSRCIYDETVPGIKFDQEGVCNYCKIHDLLDKKYPRGSEGQAKLTRIVKQIKKEGKNKEYDCVVGVSGGRDSTYLVYWAVQSGLRPLAVHYDNGWDSEIAVANIRKALSKLDVDLYTIVEDWEEFKDLQKAFLRSSTSDAEIPTDIALKKALYEAADTHGIKTIFTGYSFRTEGVSPLGWTYMEGKYINSVQKELGTKKLESFHNLTIKDIIYYVFLKGMKTIYPFSYMEYRHDEVQRILEEELGWVYYGGHHHENYYTEFFQSFYLPQKFGIDKRKTEYSALIRSGYMTREEALKKIKIPYSYNEELIPYAVKKLELSGEELEEIMSAEPKSFQDYSTYYPLLKALRIPIRILCKIDIFPEVFYLKYLS